MALDFPANPTNGQVYDNFYYDSSMQTWRALTVAQSPQIPAGVISQYAGATAPGGYVLCTGQSLVTADYPALFAAIGYTYGGSGSSFAVPNLQNRVPVSKGSGTFATLGATGGTETVALSATNLPSHTHSGTTSTTGNHTHGAKTVGGHDDNNGINGTGSTGQYLQEGDIPRLDYYSYVTYSGDHNHTFTTDGGSGLNATAVNNLQPYIVLNYIIKT